jgi:molecular chaperone DnaK (HSP70)
VNQPVGIDFGTTNSVVASFGAGTVDVLPVDHPPARWALPGFERVFPSVIGVGEGKAVTFGWAAKQQPGDKLEAVKRLFATDDTVRIGGVELSVELAAAALFGRLRAGAEAEAGAPFSRAVVTIPANSRGLARYRTRVCAGLAGIEVAALINEPTAAAMAYAHALTAADDETILVFDWGGGTLDVTVLETIAGVFIERASKGIQRSGGIDLDELFASELRRQIPGQEGWSAADRGDFRLQVERAKIALSSEESTKVALPGGGMHDVTRAELERAIRHKVEETGGPIDQCLRDLSIDASAIDRVVMVGGSSKIPAARQFVAEKLGQEPAAGVDPMTAVAEGAAIAAAILAEKLDSDFFVGTEHALGTIANNEHDVQSFSVLIPRNHGLPTEATGSYMPALDHQPVVTVRVIEGDPEVALDHPDNVVLKTWDIAVDPSRVKADAGFDITYRYDVDGILHVTVTDQKTGQEMMSDDVSFGVSQDKAGLVRTARELREILESGLLSGDAPPAAATGAGVAPPAAVDTASAAVIARVRTKIVPFVDGGEADRLEGLCRELENAEPAAAEPRREALELAARQYAYLY